MYSRESVGNSTGNQIGDHISWGHQQGYYFQVFQRFY